MSSEVEICNLALSHLGDSADVSSIDPAEGSPQAEHCARFYPIARDSLLEMHDWGFASTRAVGAAVAFPFTEWGYAYAYPTDALRIRGVLPADATDDYTAAYPPVDPYSRNSLPNQIVGVTAQVFVTETDDAGRQIILTDQVGAVIRYTRKIIDTGRFSPLFVATLARYLASYLAGPVLKGDSAITQGKAQLGIAMGMLAQAAVSDANQGRREIAHVAPWLGAR